MMQRFGGRYELLREIGSGGMGSVFEAIDVETGRLVAAKLMIASGALELQALLRFQQEGAVLATLKHPNIVTVYGTFLEAEACAIVMELLDGDSLGDLLRRERPELMQTKQIALQVLGALEYAHTRGIVHRDVKPDNIMVLPDGRVKVTDFGIARVLQAGATLNTVTGAAMGTPLYMSPEQIEGLKVDGRSDVYSFGCVIYQMVTGRPPFEGDEPVTIAFKHVHKAPQRPRDLNGSLPATWDSVILTALAKHPDERFQTAAAMREAIEPLTTIATLSFPAPPLQRTMTEPSTPVVPPEERAPQAEDKVTAASAPHYSTPASTPPTPQRPASRTGRRWGVLGGSAVVVVALVLAAVALFKTQGTATAKPVSVTVLAASGATLPPFQIRKATETRGRTVTPTGSKARLSLLPGNYLFSISNDPSYLDPAPITVLPNVPQTVHVDALYGKLVLQPAAGRVVVPDFDLADARTGKSAHNVGGTQATQGISVRPARYTIAFGPSEYTTRVPVTIRAGHQTVLNLAHIYGRLTVVQLSGAPPSGFDLIDSRSGRARSGADAGQARQGIFVPVGHYRANFYYSDVYVDPIRVTIRAGAHAYIDLNTLLAAVRTPAVATNYSVTYSWREGRETRSIQAQTRARTYYVRAGSYPLQVDANGSSRALTLRASLGKVTTLPAK